jgi:hypothetical protein
LPANKLTHIHIYIYSVAGACLSPTLTRTQLHRKRHIGNDIVNIVFQSEDAPPLNIDSFASKYTQVIIVVRVFNHGTPDMFYK